MITGGIQSVVGDWKFEEPQIVQLENALELLKF